MKALLESKQPHVIHTILDTRDKNESNGAQQLLDAVKKYFGCEVSDNLRKIYDEGCHWMNVICIVLFV